MCSMLMLSLLETLYHANDIMTRRLRADDKTSVTLFTDGLYARMMGKTPSASNVHITESPLNALYGDGHTDN